MCAPSRHELWRTARLKHHGLDRLDPTRGLHESLWECGGARVRVGMEGCEYGQARFAQTDGSLRTAGLAAGSGADRHRPRAKLCGRGDPCGVRLHRRRADHHRTGRRAFVDGLPEWRARRRRSQRRRRHSEPEFSGRRGRSGRTRARHPGGHAGRGAVDMGWRAGLAGGQSRRYRRGHRRHRRRRHRSACGWQRHRQPGRHRRWRWWRRQRGLEHGQRYRRRRRRCRRWRHRRRGRRCARRSRPVRWRRRLGRHRRCGWRRLRQLSGDRRQRGQRQRR